MEPNQDQSLFDTNMDHVTQDHLQSISKWTRFLSITGFVALGIILLVLLIAGTQLTSVFSKAYSLDAAGLAGVIIIVVIICLVIGALWVYFLFKASNLLSSGLQNRDSAMLADGFRAMRTYFIFSFVFSILGILTTLSTMF
jgi:hypothetical protein